MAADPFGPGRGCIAHMTAAAPPNSSMCRARSTPPPPPNTRCNVTRAEADRNARMHTHHHTAKPGWKQVQCGPPSSKLHQAQRTPHTKPPTLMLQGPSRAAVAHHSTGPPSRLARGPLHRREPAASMGQALPSHPHARTRGSPLPWGALRAYTPTSAACLCPACASTLPPAEHASCPCGPPRVRLAFCMDPPPWHMPRMRARDCQRTQADCHAPAACHAAGLRSKAGNTC